MTYDITPGCILETSVYIPSVEVEFRDLPAGKYELMSEDIEPGWVRIHAREVSNPYAPRTIRAINVRYDGLTIEEIDPRAKEER